MLAEQNFPSVSLFKYSNGHTLLKPYNFLSYLLLCHKHPKLNILKLHFVIILMSLGLDWAHRSGLRWSLLYPCSEISAGDILICQTRQDCIATRFTHVPDSWWSLLALSVAGVINFNILNLPLVAWFQDGVSKSKCPTIPRQ